MEFQREFQMEFQREFQSNNTQNMLGTITDEKRKKTMHCPFITLQVTYHCFISGDF